MPVAIGPGMRTITRLACRRPALGAILAAILCTLLPALSRGTVYRPGDVSLTQLDATAVPRLNLSPLPAPMLMEQAQEILVHLLLVNTGEELAVRLPFDGQLDREEAKRLSDFFRCQRSGKRKIMSAGVLAMLADLSERYPDRTIEIISGYRSKPYGAPKSKHFKGHAIDLRVRGEKLTEVRDYLWTTHGHVGLGFYPEQEFIHMDDRPGERIAWTAPREGAKNKYNPRWAMRGKSKPGFAAGTSLAAVMQVAAQH